MTINFSSFCNTEFMQLCNYGKAVMLMSVDTGVGFTYSNIIIIMDA